MQRLMITAFLTSPVLTSGGYQTFDGILASQIFDILGDVEAAHDAVPIARTDGLFHASAAFFEEFAPRQKVSVVASLRATHDLRPDLLLRKRGRVHAKISTGTRSAFGAVSSSFVQISARSATWYVEGDRSKIEDLLMGDRPIRGIGARRQSGLGAVSEWLVEDCDLNGITGYDGEILRPVPIGMMRTNKDLHVVDAAWRTAYWLHEHRAACYVPQDSHDNV